MRTDRNTARWASWGLLVLVSAMLVPSTSHGQAAPASGPLKIGFVSMRAAIEADPQYAKAESTFTKEAQAWQKELEKLQTQFDSSLAESNKSAVVLSPSAKQTKETQLRTLQTQLQQRTSDFQTRVQQREGELIGPITKRVQSIVDGIRAERNIAVIFDVGSQASNIVSVDQALDLTPVVLLRLRSPGQ